LSLLRTVYHRVVLLLCAAILMGACRRTVLPEAGWSIQSDAPGIHWIREKGTPLEYPLPSGPAYADLIRHQVFLEGRSLQKCYRRTLKKDPGLYGELFILFEVDGDGRIVEPVVDFTTMASPALEPCVLDVFRSIRLQPPPAPGMKVRYPMLFTSEKTAPEIVEALIARYHLERWSPAHEEKKRAKAKDRDKDAVPW